jgi:predicted dehydrogenase
VPGTPAALWTIASIRFILKEPGGRVSESARRVMIVGLGAAGLVHAKALEEFAQVTVIAGIDTDTSRALTFRESQVNVYPGVFDTTSDKLDPNVVVIATPTPTHAQVCDEVAEYFPKATILLEKPAADNLGDAQRIIEGIGGKQAVSIAYHMAFSPEVSWALEQARKRTDHLGWPTLIESWHADPYQLELASAEARLGTSWIDSGINALSVIERFARITERTSLRQIGEADKSEFEGNFICAAPDKNLTAIVLTSWHSTASARTTRIRYSSGAELVMDHAAVAGYLLEGGMLSAKFGSDGRTPRREAHYKAMYKSWLIDGEQAFPKETSLRLHRLLLEQPR